MRSVALAGSLLVLASGCATQHEEAARSEPASEHEHEELAAEPAALEASAPAEAEDAAARSFEQLQQELAVNHAKLRELGVVLDHQLAEPEPELGGASESQAKPSGKASSAGPKVAPAPGSKPSADKPAKSEKKLDNKQKRDATRGKSKDELDEDFGPEAAKAASPSASNELDPQARCQTICDLAAISCGLGDEICELADRHPDEPEYASACERANGDCEAAKEACDACAT